VKKLLLTFLFFINLIYLEANQPFGNEWINYNQQYFTVRISENGIYRINYNTLLQAGVPIGSFDPRGFQMFHAGEEQPIIVKNENTGLFQQGDYIEFYAGRNTGWFDRWLYKNEQHHPNPSYSLFNDTTTYYLTWNNLLSNRRYILETDASFTNYIPAPYFWNTVREDYTSSYYAGQTNNYGVTDPEYTQAQGWFDAAFNLGQSRSKTIQTPNGFLAGPAAEIEMAVAGASNFASLDPDHHLRIQFAGQMIDTIYDGYKLLRFQRQLPVSALNASGTTFVFSSVNDLGSPVDRNAIVYINIRYPHNFNLRNLKELNFDLPPSQGSKTLIQFSNFDASSQDTVWIYNPSNNRKVVAFPHEQGYRALVPFASQLRKCYLTSSSRVRSINNIQPVNTDPNNFARFQNFLSPQHFNSTYLMITHKSLMQAAASYRDYRNSTGYKVLLVDIDQLYHQFAYGIWKHPLATRNFARFTIAKYDNPPTKLFLIGKAMNARSLRKTNQSHNYAASLVPSFGDPSSDILITAGLTEGTLIPAIPTGRLSAKNPEHVLLYLEKIMQYEAAQQHPEEWMKNVLHFGGGSSLAEQMVLKSYLKGYENIISDTLFGGHVRTFLKSSTEPIQINQSDSLKQIINNGVSLMTFFGHAAGIGFDISIDYPSEYNNYGKYPFLIANSCFAGDLFGSSHSSSEEFVLIANKGTIGYLASTSSAGPYELNQYTRAFLSNLSGSKYGRPVGENIQQVIREIESTNMYIKNICLLNTYHGDPALVINHQPKPDYSIQARDIFFSPADVSTELESFTVNVICTNIGRAIRDSIMVEMVHTFADGTSTTYLKRIGGVMFKDTLSFELAVDREKGIGLNHFRVTLNAFNETDELTMLNNTATTSLLIRSPDIIPVLPYNYAIVPDNQVTLIASTGDSFAGEQNYIFEFTDDPSSNSPLRHSVTQRGGVISWQPPVILADSTVYFWRVSLDSAETGAYSWRKSSFQYIQGREGWSQAHFKQFENNTYRFVEYNKTDQQWDFVNNFLSIQFQTGVYPYIPWNEVFLRVNGINTRTWSCLGDTGNGLLFHVFDPVSGDLWHSHPLGSNAGTYGNHHCTTGPTPSIDFFTSSETWRERARAFLDTIPQGHYVLAASHRNHFAEQYNEELYQAFESIGSANIRHLVNNRPYIIFGRKGNPMGSANEILGGTISSIIQLNDSLQTNWNQGYILSERIGPARHWESISWRHQSLEALSTDSVWLQVLGVKHNGNIDTLFSYIPADQSYIPGISQQIDAAIYPYIHLKVNMRDDINRTPAQMQRWQVIYQGIPEAAIDPSSHFHFLSEQLPEGKQLEFSTAIRNISKYDMDSLLVKYWIMDKDRNIIPG
jgi:hypothetical protein